MESTCTLNQQLVYDLGHFIGVILEKEKLSADAEKRRSELHQSLQPFISPEIEIPEEEVYEDPTPIRVCSQVSIQSVSGQSDDGSKLNITLSELKKESIKYGPLWRKEKGLFREVWRQYWSGIYEQKLILFYSEKDPKPTTCINIQGYVARPAPNIQRVDKRKGITFELICPGKKDYQFFARTAKDMEQWVAIICQTSIQHIDMSFPRQDHRLVISTDDNDVETYDEATPTDEEEIYDDIDNSKQQTTTPAKEEQEELYNDVEDYETREDKPIICHVERKFDIKDYRPPMKSNDKEENKDEEEEEEEIYHDIAEYQRQLPPKPVPKVEIEVSPPPLPSRRPLPSIPKEEEEEEEENYEDISTNQVDQPEQVVTQQCEEEEEEETYDDVGNSRTQTASISEEEEQIYDDVASPQTNQELKEENPVNISILVTQQNVNRSPENESSSVKNLRDRFNTNTSFLYRNSSQEKQTVPSDSEIKFSNILPKSPTYMNSESSASRLPNIKSLNYVNSEKFQNALKKIEGSFSPGMANSPVDNRILPRKPNMLNPSITQSTQDKPAIEISVLPNKPTIPPNKPSTTIKVTMPIRNSSDAPKICLSRTPVNKPNGLPVSIPIVPDTAPPKLPPRSYLK